MKGGRKLYLDDDYSSDDYEYIPVANDTKIECRRIKETGLEKEETNLKEEKEKDHSKQVKNLFEKINKLFDISNCDEQLIIKEFALCDYQIRPIIKMLKAGELGRAILKNSNASESYLRSNQLLSTEEKSIKKNANYIFLKQSDQPTHSDEEIQNIIKDSQNKKKHANVVIIGHVDTGKSTLIGHILCITGNVSESNFNSLLNESKSVGKEENAFAWVMTDDESERFRGVSINVSMANISTEDREITILDAPGHRDFVSTMIAGASQADTAILVVDVTNPDIENGQAGDHLLLCRSIGVSNLVVCINKMDAVNYEKKAFYDAVKSVKTYLKKIGWNTMRFIPTSATKEEDITNPRKNMKWYIGPSIIKELNNLDVPQYNINEPFLMCVADSTQDGHKVTVQGKIESGFVCPNDHLKSLPSNKIICIRKVVVGGKEVSYASAGEIATLYFNIVEESELIFTGETLVDPKSEFNISKTFIAKVRMFDIKKPVAVGTHLLFNRKATECSMKVEKILKVMHPATKKVKQTILPIIRPNSISEVCFVLDSPNILDTNLSLFNSFVIRYQGSTIGLGKVIGIKKNV